MSKLNRLFHSTKQKLLKLPTAAVLTLLAIFGSGISAHSQLLPAIEIAPGGPNYRAGEVIVQFKKDVNNEQLQAAVRVAGLTLIKQVRTPAMSDHGQVGLTHLMTSMSVPEAVRALKNLPGVEFAEPNWIYQHQADSNDPLYLDGTLWGMYGDDLPSAVGPPNSTNPYGSQAEKAWSAGYTGSSTIFLGIIDEGIQFDHPDLAANIWTNPGEIPGNGIDDDGDGYVDDVHGWNALDDNGTIYDPGYDPHGTHVSGTAGASGGNGLGVAGVNWNVTLVSGKFLGRNGGGSVLDAAQAIDYMTMLRTRKGLNIVALNNSYGGGGFSQTLLDAITRAAQAGILFSVAAMNNTNNNDANPVYPASYDTTATAGYDSVIAVAAIDQNGNKAVFSNYGQNSVDLGAPGVGIYSTLPTNSYGSYKGTSMATPHVTGAIGLYASIHPEASAQSIRNTLLTTGVRPLASLQGITVTGGMLDIGSMMTAPPTFLPGPATPASLQPTVVAGNRVDLSWLDQSDNELGFAIERSTNGQTYALVDTVGANFTGYSDRTVRPGSTCLYRLRSYNPGGSSDYVYASSSVTTPQVSLPATPSSLTASAPPKGGGVNLAWVDNANNEDGFQIERKTGSAGTWQLLASVSANTVKYFDSTTTSRTSYSYRVRSFNAAGSSAYSNTATVMAK